MKSARLALLVALASLFVLVIGQAAFAGEYAPGKGYNDAPTHANSECVYNGVDDLDPEDDLIWGLAPSKGKVQSGGQLIAIQKNPNIDLPPGLPPYLTPPPGVQGVACNGHLNPLQGGDGG
jgi:hypothetical protein